MAEQTMQMAGTEVVEETKIDISSAITQTQTREDMQKAIEAIAGNKLKELLAHEAELHAEIDRLSSLENENRDSRLISVKQADLETTRAEIAKRGEDLATLSYSIAGEMDVFGRLSGDALQDNEEDIAKKEAANDALNRAEKALITAESTKTAAENSLTDFETAKTKAKNSFIFGRKKRVAAADQHLRIVKQRILNAQSAIEAAENNLEEAKTNIPIVLEQVEVDKRTRIKDASLEETYALISKWVAQAKNILKDDISEYTVRIVETKEASSKAIERRQKAAERMRAAEIRLTELEANYDTCETDRSDITDRTDPTYQKITKQMEELAIELDAAKNEKKLAEGSFSDAEIAAKERSTSLKALTAQNELAKHQFNKFVISEETAHFIGQNIEVLVKGSVREVLNESLDKGIHKMTITVYEVAQKLRVSSGKQLGDMQERKLEVLEILEELDGETDEAVAINNQRLADVTQKLREGYSQKGADPDEMSNLAAAAELASKVTGMQQESKIGDGDLY